MFVCLLTYLLTQCVERCTKKERNLPNNTFELTRNNNIYIKNGNIKILLSSQDLQFYKMQKYSVVFYHWQQQQQHSACHIS